MSTKDTHYKPKWLSADEMITLQIDLFEQIFHTRTLYSPLSVLLVKSSCLRYKDIDLNVASCTAVADTESG